MHPTKGQLALQNFSQRFANGAVLYNPLLLQAGPIELISHIPHLQMFEGIDLLLGPSVEKCYLDTS